MKISLHEGGSLVWIAPGGQSAPDALRHSSSSASGMQPYVEAAFAVARSRGNIQNNFSFSVARDFATPALGEDFIVSHAALATSTGVLTFTLSDDTTVYYAYGNVKIAGTQPEGCTVTTSYSIECGKISKTKSIA